MIADLPRFRLERPDPVESDRVFFRRLVPFPLGGEDVHENGAAKLLDVAEVLDEGINRVAGQGANIFEPQLLEKKSGKEETLEGLFGILGPLEGGTADAGELP